MGSFKKSISWSTSLSQTMSMWLCKTTVSRFSKPLVAGFRIKTFPVSSILVSRPRLSPKSLRYWIIFSSCLEGRGIWLILANCSNTHAGFKSLLFIINVILFWNSMDIPYLCTRFCITSACKDSKNAQNYCHNRVNNCYLHSIIERKSDFQKGRKVLLAAYSWQ